MKLGIKVGPQHQSIDDINAVHPEMAEVWYNMSQKDEYDELFRVLTHEHIDVGLHFWAVPHGYLPTLAGPDKSIIDKTMRLIQASIDTACVHHFSYVNIHPGSRARVKFSLTPLQFSLDSDPIPEALATEQLLTHGLQLHEYAKKRNIILTIETVCSRQINDYWENGVTRQTAQPINIYDLTPTMLASYASAGGYIANDFGHTAANTINTDAQIVWENLKQTTMQLASQTKLLHLGFLIPPYNGTDFHDSFDNPRFYSIDAVPNFDQWKELM